MNISAPQFKAFSKPARETFEEEMLLHFRAFAPELARIVGDPALREFITASVDQAGVYGFTQRGPVQFFIELKFSLGSDFVRDPQLHRFAPILHDREADQMLRAKALYLKSKEYFDLVGGPDDVCAQKALVRVREMSLDDFGKHSGAPGPAVLEEFRSIYPEKYNYAGKPALAQLVAQSTKEAKALSLDADFVRLFAGLKFGFGSGILLDPLYPWVGKTVQAESMAPNPSTTRLRRKINTYIDGMLPLFRNSRS